MTAGLQDTPAMPPRHRLPAEMLRKLARGAGGAAAMIRLVAAQHSKNVLAIRWLTELAERTGHPEAGLARNALDLLGQFARTAPEAVHRVLRDPMVGAWAMQTALRLYRAPELPSRPGQLAAVAVAAAVRSGVPLSIVLPEPAPGQQAVDLPTLGRVQLPPAYRDGVEARVHADGRVELGYGPRWLPLPDGLATDGPGWIALPRFETVTAGLALRVRFDGSALAGSALRAAGAGPPQTDLLRLSPADRSALRRWHRRLSGGWGLLVHRHRRVAAEVSAAISVVAPLRAPDKGQTSGTYRGAFGCVALSLPPDDVTAAATLAHEIQHAKLAALMDLIPLVRPGGEQLFYAPWREDPRPVTGLLHGLYAHLGVAGFWRRQLRAERHGAGRLVAETEYVRWRDACREVAAVLAGQPALTPTGGWFVAQLADVLDGWRDTDAVSGRARRLAAESAAQHRRRWIDRYGDGSGA